MLLSNMNRLFLIVSLLFVLVALNKSATGQALVNEPDYLREYDRNSLTVLMLDYNNRHNNYGSCLRKAMYKLAVPSKFDNNMLSTRVVNSADNSDNIRQALESSKIPNDIFSKWFSRGADGSFNMSVIHERGMYNATDADVIEASASKVGLAKLQDAGESLIGRSYVMVLSFRDIKTMEQYYDELDANRKSVADLFNTKYIPVARTKNGYRADVVGYIYKLSNLSASMDDFYSNMWIFDEDSKEDRSRKINAFDNANFNLEYVTTVIRTVEASQLNVGQQKSQEDLFVDLANASVEGLVYESEAKVEAWKVVTALYDTHPLRAKIGTKENLNVDDRYFVYEYRMNKDNQVYASRRGVVRVKKVAGNSQVAQGQSDNDAQQMSSFYQVAGHRLEPGMFMEQNNDRGLGVTFGYATGAQSGVFINIEALANNGISNTTQLKGFLAGHIDFGNYNLNDCGLFQYDSDLEDASFCFFGGEFGFSKGFFPLRNVALSAHGGFAIEFADFAKTDLSKEYFEGGMVDCLFSFVGAQMAINMKYNVQLVGGMNYYVQLENAMLTKKNDEDEKSLGVTYSSMFDGRVGANINLGVRIQF